MEGRIRGIRSTEYYKLRPLGIKNMEQAKKYFANETLKVLDITSKSYKDLKNFEHGYLQEKQQEKDLLANMGKIHETIYIINRPVQHVYELRKLD